MDYNKISFCRNFPPENLSPAKTTGFSEHQKKLFDEKPTQKSRDTVPLSKRYQFDMSWL